VDADVLAVGFEVRKARAIKSAHQRHLAAREMLDGG